MRRGTFFFLSFFLITAFLTGAGFALQVHAQATSDIQAQIDQHNQLITQLNAEIATYQKQLDALGTQHQTLATSINSLDVTRAQLAAKIKALQQKIAAANLQLQQLQGQITTKQQDITLEQQTLAASLRDIASADSLSIVEQVFAADNLSDAWRAVDANISINDALRSHTQVLSQVKQQLTAEQQSVHQAQTQLVSLTTDLGTQKKAVDVTVQQKSQLLTQTKSQESVYQALIATKKAQEKAFESELTSLEGQLKSVGAGSIPHVGQGILSWPYSASFASHCVGIQGALKNPYCITQYFGNTPFSTANPSVYNGAGHNGIDIGMPIGTPVQAALSGIVLGTGNTDLAHDSKGNQCYSFGKWVMVKHANGLATLYAHLSQINASKGQAVATGDVLGYSGMTGYATGPHLHFGVYASAGVQILTLNQFRGATTACANATMPVAPLNAYLNPMSYL